jgi:hypothetical protein
VNKKSSESLEEYLSDKVFKGKESLTTNPDQRDVDGFALFMDRYKKGLVIESTAVNVLSTKKN